MPGRRPELLRRRMPSHLRWDQTRNLSLEHKRDSFDSFPPHSGVWELHPPFTEGYGQSAQHAFWFPREIILLLLHMAKTISESQLREVLS